MMSRATHASHQSTGADLMQGQDPCFTLKLPDTTNWIFQYLFISSLVVMIDIFTINAVKCYCRPLVLNLDPDITEAAEQQIIFIKPGESQDQCRCSAHKKLTACLCTWWHFPWSFPGLHESPFLSSFWMSGCQAPTDSTVTGVSWPGAEVMKHFVTAPAVWRKNCHLCSLVCSASSSCQLE